MRDDYWSGEMNGKYLIRLSAVLLASRAVRCGRESISPFVNGPIPSLSDDESDVDELDA